jgi:hypothetical protein
MVVVFRICTLLTVTVASLAALCPPARAGDDAHQQLQARYDRMADALGPAGARLFLALAAPGYRLKPAPEGDRGAPGDRGFRFSITVNAVTERDDRVTALITERFSGAVTDAAGSDRQLAVESDYRETWRRTASGWECCGSILLRRRRTVDDITGG